MRFLGVGDFCELGDMYLRLAREGHDVRVYVGSADSRETLTGFVTRSKNWRHELKWVKDAGADGIIIFESADAGATQDKLRARGFNVIGGSAYGDRLESDREFGQEVLRRVGVKTAPTLSFKSYDEAIAHVRANGGRYVFKPSGHESSSMDSYVGELEDGSDVVDVLESQAAADGAREFILMQHLDGIEVGVGAFFNGQTFLEPACIDFEHKRFFPGNMGELTGEMGTLVSYRGADRIFDATLRKVAPLLAASGYCGYINLNTIVNDAGIWPLEFTSRFGYPGFSILSALQVDAWGSLLRRICQRDGTTLDTRPGYAVGVVLTIPPYPYVTTNPASPTGLRIHFRSQLTAAEMNQLHYCEVALKDGRLTTAGVQGQVMVVTGQGESAAAAQKAAYALADKVVVANLRYRRDIGERFIARDRESLVRMGLFVEN
jgi:phosphoribosylamine--glycine ligase